MRSAGTCEYDTAQPGSLRQWPGKHAPKRTTACSDIARQYPHTAASYAEPLSRVLATAKRAWSADIIERLLPHMRHRARPGPPASCSCSKAEVIFGVAIDDTVGGDAI